MLIEYVKRLSDLGVVKRIHNTEGWLNQMLFVKKGDGSLRPCLDLRATINSLSRPLVSSLPHAQDCVDALGGSKYITIQDAKSAYWQLELHPDDIKYTSFSSPLGTLHPGRDGVDFIAAGVDKCDGHCSGGTAVGVHNSL